RRENDPYNFILRRYGGFVAALGLACCAKEGREAISEVEFRILTGELFEIGMIDPASEWYQKHELLPLTEALRTASARNELIGRIDADKDFRFLLVVLELSRLAVIQWEGYSHPLADWVRAVLLYEEFRKICIEQRSCSIDELRKAERIFFGTSYD